jgi:hypothetical protein
MMTTDRDKFSKTVARTTTIIGKAVPDLTTARDFLDQFLPPHPTPEEQNLDAWIAARSRTCSARLLEGLILNHETPEIERWGYDGGNRGIDRSERPRVNVKMSTRPAWRRCAAPHAFSRRAGRQRGRAARSRGFAAMRAEQIDFAKNFSTI